MKESLYILHRILSRKFIFEFQDSSGEAHRGVYYDPSLDILLESEFEY